MRTLELHPDKPALYYSWRVCADRNLFGNCKKWVQKREECDLTKPEVRAQLRAAGFVMRVEEKQ